MVFIINFVISIWLRDRGYCPDKSKREGRALCLIILYGPLLTFLGKLVFNFIQNFLGQIFAADAERNADGQSQGGQKSDENA